MLAASNGRASVGDGGGANKMAGIRVINYCWRLLVTGFCFGGFAIGGLLSAIVLSVMQLLPGDRRTRQRRSRRVVSRMFGLMIQTLCVTGTMRLHVSGLEKFEQYPGSLVLANHPTLIDVVILLWKHPTAGCVVKSKLWKNPFYWGVVRMTGYIDNASSDALIDACVERLSVGESLLIFPEGTRTRPGQALHFVRGAAYVALKHGKPLLPVLITCTPPTLTKGAPWYRIPPRAFEIHMKVLDPVAPAALVNALEYSPIGARRLTDALQNYFTDHLAAYGQH
ncbi:MAG TPA: lysophospholipid acyltransferase family protein [Rhodocyclaceae bacterium]|nr:lysophospholipid acyltransferase family protein [Rhodocyclaceae bacterium]